MSKPINSLFEDAGVKFLPNERYYVGAMYAQTLPSGTEIYGKPNVSEFPLFVPASQIYGLQPGDEIHYQTTEDRHVWHTAPSTVMHAPTVYTPDTEGCTECYFRVLDD